MVSTKKWWAPLWLFEARAGSGCRADAYLSFGSDELMTPVRIGNCLPGSPGREQARADDGEDF